MARKTGLRKKEQDERLFRAAHQPHRRNVPGEEATDPRLESPLGRLFFYGTISEAMYQAGRKYAEIVAGFRTSIGAPYAFPGAIDFDSALVTGPMVLPPDDECEKIKKEYNAAFIALGKAGQPAAKAVSRCAVHEEETNSLQDLCDGLKQLAHHFELLGRKARIIPFSNFRPL